MRQQTLPSMALHALLQSVLLLNVINANPRGMFVSLFLAICTVTTTKNHFKFWRKNGIIIWRLSKKKRLTEKTQCIGTENMWLTLRLCCRLFIAEMHQATGFLQF